MCECACTIVSAKVWEELELEHTQPGMEQLQQATTGQGSDSVRRKKRSKELVFVDLCSSVGREFHKEKVE